MGRETHPLVLLLMHACTHGLVLACDLTGIEPAALASGMTLTAEPPGQGCVWVICE